MAALQLILLRWVFFVFDVPSFLRLLRGHVKENRCLRHTRRRKRVGWDWSLKSVHGAHSTSSQFGPHTLHTHSCWFQRCVPSGGSNPRPVKILKTTYNSASAYFSLRKKMESLDPRRSPLFPLRVILYGGGTNGFFLCPPGQRDEFGGTLVFSFVWICSNVTHSDFFFFLVVLNKRCISHRVPRSTQRCS